MDQGARPEAQAKRRGKPTGSRQRAGPNSGDSWCRENRVGAAPASCLRSFLAIFRISSALSLLLRSPSLCPSRSLPHLKTLTSSRQPRIRKPSTQSLTLRDRNSSWQLRRNSSLQRPLSLHSVSHPTPNWPPACPRWKPRVNPENRREGRRGVGDRDQGGQGYPVWPGFERHPNFLITAN